MVIYHGKKNKKNQLKQIQGDIYSCLEFWVSLPSKCYTKGWWRSPLSPLPCMSLFITALYEKTTFWEWQTPATFTIGCNFWGCNPLGFKGFSGIQSLGALTMWCSPSSVSFSQRTRTLVCSDESSQRCRKFANDSWPSSEKRSERVGSNMAEKTWVTLKRF